jgi:phosphoribosylformylglycinamidine synthase
VVRVHGTEKALAMTTDVTPRYCFADPREGGKQAIAEAYRNLCSVGATPLATTDCMNFGNPQRPEIMGQFVGCIEGMAEACRALDFPIVSGNVSLYNETKGEDGAGSAILPTPAIGGVGLLKDWSKSVGIAFKGPGDVIVLIGKRRGHLGQSLWLREIHGREDGPPPPVDLASERSAGEFVRAAIAGGAITACHDVSGGGIAVALAEMALAGNVGALINKLRPESNAALFAEDQGLYVATICDNCLLTFLARAHSAGVDVQAIGRTCGSRLIFELPEGDHAVSLADLRSAHEGFFPKLMGGEPAAA